MSTSASTRAGTPVASAPLSVFDMFRIGIGPSSSHTVGPMRAARTFAEELAATGRDVVRLRADLFGSLGATGRGHGTDRAVLLGLAGHEPETVASDVVEGALDEVAESGTLDLLGGRRVTLDLARDVVFRPRDVLDFHPNGLRLTAWGDETGAEDDAEPVLSRTYFSVGGGFVVPDPEGDAPAAPPTDEADDDPHRRPHAFACADDLLDRCSESGRGVAGVMLANECATRTETEVETELLRIWAAMDECIDAGCAATGTLPGSLRVPRRAHVLHEALLAEGATDDPLRAMDWVNLYALAVNEENASGHRVVTAPTNGAAGIVPAVLRYYRTFVPGADDAGTVRFLLAAAAIGILVKTNASIAGAEVGCQGEVGSACAMAAAGLAEVLGGTPEQVENAAEIAMEHNLGLTCDPIGGLVQIPCIERNAIGAVKAINAARMALRGDGRHTVSLDAVIETMRQTGEDMHSKYKETSLGGLAVNIVEC